jgi:hypothetical protein
MRADDVGQHGVAPGAHDEHARRAAAHRAAEEDAVRALAQRRVGGIGHAGALFHREGLAREAGLGDEEVARLQHHAVGRHEVAGGQVDDVAGHHLGGGPRLQHAVAPDAHHQRQAPAQPLGLRARPGTPG